MRETREFARHENMGQLRFEPEEDGLARKHATSRAQTELDTEFTAYKVVRSKSMGQLGFEPRASTLSEWRST